MVCEGARVHWNVHPQGTKCSNQRGAQVALPLLCVLSPMHKLRTQVAIICLSILSLACGLEATGSGVASSQETAEEAYDHPNLDATSGALQPDTVSSQFPGEIQPDQWSVVATTGASGAPGHRKATLSNSVQVPTGFQMRNYSGPVSGGVAALGQTRQISPGETWVTNSQMMVGATCFSVMFWYRESDGAFLLAHPPSEQVVFVIPGLNSTDGGVQPLKNISPPKISGTPAVGQTLTASPGDWSLATTQTQYQWQRGGANIAGATAQTYVVLATDASQNLRVVVSVKSGTQLASATSAEVKIGSTTGKVWTVATSAQLVAAMKSSAGGDTILMQSGVYSTLTVSDVVKNGVVTIRAATPNNPPRFTSNPAMSLRRLTNFAFEGFKCELSGATETNGGVTRATVGSKCIEFYALTNVTFRHNWFDFFGQGIVTASGSLADVAGQVSKNVVIENNRFTRRAMDAIRIFRPVNGLTIRRNIFENDLVDASRASESTRHPDIIQFATSAVAAGSSNVLIEQNKITVFDGYSHTFFLFSERASISGITSADAFHNNVTVRNNDIIAPHRNAIAFGGVKNAVASGNRLRSSPPNNYASEPIINFYSGCTGSVSNNTAPGPANAQTTGALSNVTQSGNVWNTETATPKNWVELTGLAGPQL